MDRENRRLDTLENQPVGSIQRLSFDVSANRRLHRRMLSELKARPVIDEVYTFRDPEDE
jgi:putative Mg2+ transporter-C (MgtC) family protein